MQKRSERSFALLFLFPSNYRQIKREKHFADLTIRLGDVDRERMFVAVESKKGENVVVKWKCNACSLLFPASRCRKHIFEKHPFIYDEWMQTLAEDG